jgi:hypothetical protein
LGSIAPSTLDLGKRSLHTTMSFKRFKWAEIRLRHMVAVSLSTHYYNAAYWYSDVRNNWNVVIGGLGRICINTPPVDKDMLNIFSGFVNMMYDEYFPKDVIPQTYEHYLQKNKSYSVKRKAALLVKHREFEQLTLTDKVKWTEAATFIKQECYDDVKKPRLINPRSDYFKAYVGDVISTADEVIYQSFDWMHVKHLDVKVRPLKLRDLFADFPVTCTDFTSWEASIKSEIMLTCECALLMRLFASTVPDWKLAYIIVAMTGIQYCRSDYGVVFEMVAERLSGDLWTSSFNFLVNCLITLFSYYMQFYTDMAMIDYVTNVRSIVKCLFEGDDGIHCCERGQLQPLHYTKLGFIAKMDYYDNCSVASFCGQVFHMNTLVNQTNPMKFILRFGWAGSRYHDSSEFKLRQLLKAKAYSYAYLYTQCPIIYPIVYNLIKLLDTMPLTEKLLRRVNDPYVADKIVLGVKFPPVNINVDDRHYMSQKFGISDSDQMCIERDLIQCGLNPWRSATLDALIPERHREFFDDQCRFQYANYIEYDSKVDLH